VTTAYTYPVCMQESVGKKPQRMVRKQILITPEQNRRLKARAAQTGTAEADIVRHGIDMALAAEQASEEDWRQGLDRLSGAWAERHDMQDFVRDLRKGGGRRMKRLGLARD
jgi:hypothetical protein